MSAGKWIVGLGLVGGAILLLHNASAAPEEKAKKGDGDKGKAKDAPAKVPASTATASPPPAPPTPPRPVTVAPDGGKTAAPPLPPPVQAKPAVPTAVTPAVTPAKPNPDHIVTVTTNPPELPSAELSYLDRAAAALRDVLPAELQK